MDHPEMGRREWLLLASLSVCWGSSFFFIEVALRDLPIFTIVLLRVSIAAILLMAFVHLQGLRLPKKLSDWGGFILLGALRAAIPISLIVWAETRIDSGLAGILNSTSPLFTAIIAHFFTQDDKLSRNRLMGIGVSMTGVITLIGPNALAGSGSAVVAQLAILGATCSYGFAAVYGRQFRNTQPAVSAAGMLIGAAILVAPLSFFEQPWTRHVSVETIGAIVGLSVVSTALAFIIWFKLIFTAGASNTSLVTFLIPITALILGIVVLNETIELESMIGLGLILLGLAIAQNRLIAFVMPFQQKLRESFR